MHRRIIATAASICLVFIIGMTSLGVSAEVKGFAGNVFSDIKGIVGLRGSSQGNAIINKTVTDSKVSITVQDVLCDEYGVYVSFIVKSDKAFINTNDTQLLLYDDYGKTSFHKGDLDTGGVAGLDGKFIDKYTFIGVETYLFRHLKTEVLENFTLDINIGAVSLNTVADDSVIRGKWKFSVPVKLNSEGVKIITPAIKQNNISKKKVTLSKLNTFIEIEVPTSLTNEKFTVVTDKGVTIDPISCENKENNGKTTKIWRLKGIPDGSDGLILNIGDTNPESIIINIK
ncbi:DUF4179 domain-containing protein [Clostridium bowmanii]|uniref:DUF4179 domain-containing protein n=1 Tax=Clostridium bowmanii TaxID=132925 RepID=UPI001C0E7150|nr:DUF4179 domain-containing protein [Clostridium bowmanii]MBU3192215.1 DUF4179 domain-containing protein [Clostridium bowmanii]MCA1076425.1 DUF4179 domain-containing protein [Clostridium bowmanii]